MVPAELFPFISRFYSLLILYKSYTGRDCLIAVNDVLRIMSTSPGTDTVARLVQTSGADHDWMGTRGDVVLLLNDRVWQYKGELVRCRMTFLPDKF